MYGLLDVYNVKGYEFHPSCGAFPDGNIEVAFAQSLHALAPKTIQRVFYFAKVLLIETHLSKTLPSDDIIGAVVIHQDATNVIAEEAVGVSTNICPDDHHIIVRMSHEPYVTFLECDGDVGPSCSKDLALANLIDTSHLIFPLPLCSPFGLV